MMRNGVPGPPERLGGSFGAETTSPPAVIAWSFQEIPTGLKARRSWRKDQHLCHLDPLPPQELAPRDPQIDERAQQECAVWAPRIRVKPGVPPPGSGRDLDRFDAAKAGTGAGETARGWMNSASQEGAHFLSEVLLRKWLRQERGTRFQ